MMKPIRLLTTSILLMLLMISMNLFADPPTAPAGFRWEVVEALTDEFNDNTINTNKWIKTNPFWIGRAPGLFKEAQVTEGGGNLRLKNTKVAETSAARWVHTGFLASKSNTVFLEGMYSESRLKCARDGTVTGFWMSQTNSSSKQEIDVQEGIGWPANGNNNLTTRMRMNTHTKTNLVTPKTEPTGAGVGDQYFVYGVWWKDKRNLEMYLGNNKVATHKPQEDFTGGMQLNLNTELQTWLGPPSVAHLNNNNRNTTLVDYVRTWRLVPVGTNPVPSNDDKVSMQNWSSKRYVSSENGVVPMTSNRVSVGSWEKFELIDTGGGTKAIKGNNGKYVSSENGAKRMTCNRNSIGAWEKFTFEHKGNQIYAIKGNNGKYVGDNMLCNSSTADNDLQRFKLAFGLKAGEVSLKSLEDTEELSVYPTVANEFLTISGVAEGDHKVIIYNLQGRAIRNSVLKFKNGPIDLDVNDLTTGMYILNLQGNTTNKSIRFIKE